MAITFNCTQCGKSYTIDDSLAGKHAKCSCGTEMTVPAPSVRWSWRSLTTSENASSVDDDYYRNNALPISIGPYQKPDGNWRGGQQGDFMALNGTIGIISLVVALIMSIVVLIGARKMMTLESYGFSTT